MSRLSGRTRVFVLPAFLFVVGCGTQAAPLHQLQDAKADVPALASEFDSKTTGTITGRVQWDGEFPSEHSLRDAKIGVGKGIDELEKKNLGLPRIGQAEKGVAGAIVYLRKVVFARSKPWNLLPARVGMKNGSIAVEQGESQGSTGFVHVGDQIEMTSASNRFDMLRAQGAAFFTIPFPEADKPPVRRSLVRPGVVELSSGAGNYLARSWLFVMEHPYVTRTDETGRFKLTDVPEGEYEVVCWMPNWRVQRYDRDPEMLNVARVVFAPPMEKSSPARVHRDGVVYVQFLTGIADFPSSPTAVTEVKTAY